MATERKPEIASNDAVRRERRTGSLRGVLYATLALVVISVLIHYSVVGLFTVLKQRYNSLDMNTNPVQTAQPHRLPPEPRLQWDEAGDLRQLRQREDSVLQTYGWVDQPAGVVRIPVARALELAARQGLPQFVAPVAAAAGKGKGK